MEPIASSRRACVLMVAAFIALHVQAAGAEATCVDPRAVRVSLHKNGAPVKASPACRIGAGETASTRCDTFLPSPGEASIWVEDRDVISPRRVDVVFDPRCAGDLAMRVVTAGVVGVTTNATVQLIHIAGLEPGFERAVASTSRVRMPLGTAVAVALDKQDRVAAVSRPFVVRDESATLDWATAQVPAVVMTFDIAPEAAGEPFELLTNERIRPDVILTHRGRHMAIWYGVTTPDARITIESRRLHMQPVTVATDRRRVVNAHGSIRPRPALTVKVTIPEEVQSALDEATLTVSDAAATTALARSEDVTPAQQFPYLPPTIVKAVLEIDSHRLTRTANLSDGESRTIDFDLQPYVVSGVVNYGDERAKARIEFRRDESIHTSTDATGRYEVVLWEGGKYVAEVRLDDLPGVPSHLDLVDIERNTTMLDFRVPKAEHRVRVVDDQTGAPIERALITVFNSWDDPKQGSRKVGRNVATGPDGEVLLPGLRPGTAVVHVSASGYHGADPLQLISGPGQPPRTIEIRLRPREAGRNVAVVLPDGSPATGARLSALSAGAPVWSGTADKDGSVAMPSTLQAQVLLASHPGAGLYAGRWIDGAEPLTITLPSSSAPVVVKVLRDDGSPARHAQVTIWLDGIAITDPALTVFTGSIAATDAEGVWIGRALPPAAIKIAAVQSRSRTPGSAPLESLSTPIPFPWPDVVTIRTID